MDNKEETAVHLDKTWTGRSKASKIEKMKVFMESTSPPIVNIGRQLDTIYDYVDSCFLCGEFNVVDGIFVTLLPQAESMDINIILGYLTASYPAKSKLPNRKIFFDKCASFIDKELLKGLE